MVEETKEQVIDQETKDALGEASLKRIGIIYNLVKEYFRALNDGTLNSTEFTLIGMDCVQAGLKLISRSNMMDQADVDSSIAVMKAIQATINSTFEKVYLNPEIVAQQVAQSSFEAIQRKGLAKNLKKEDI